MKRIAGVLVVAALVGTPASAQLIEMRQTIFGMDWAVCARAVSVAVQDIPGVASADVSLNDGLAVIAFNAVNESPVAQIRRAIRDNGFSPKDADVRITGTLQRTNDGLVLESGGTQLRLNVHPDAGTMTLGDHVSTRVEVVGVILESAGDNAALSLLARSVKRAAQP